MRISLYELIYRYSYIDMQASRSVDPGSQSKCVFFQGVRILIAGFEGRRSGPDRSKERIRMKARERKPGTGEDAFRRLRGPHPRVVHSDNGAFSALVGS